MWIVVPTTPQTIGEAAVWLAADLGIPPQQAKALIEASCR
jgi:hypothetical protein